MSRCYECCQSNGTHSSGCYTGQRRREGTDHPPVVNRGRKRELDGQSALPRMNRYSIPPPPGSVQCDLCPSWVKPQGLADHMRDKHRVTK